MTLYDTIGRGYAVHRRPDARIAGAIDAALGDAASVVNVGAGAGSYEPVGRSVVAVEPSEVMIRQRAAGSARCVQGRAESLPLEAASFDAAMAVLTVHHWTNLQQGLRELARVARRRVVLVTWVPDAPPFWLTDDYFPEIVAYDRTIFPGTARLAHMLEDIVGPTSVSPLPIPHDCSDGFLCAYWRRPAMYLDAHRRAAISSFARIDAAAGLARLEHDLASGAWATRNRAVLGLDAFDAGYRVFTCEVAGSRNMGASH